jgi:hypothetical protein
LNSKTDQRDQENSNDKDGTIPSEAVLWEPVLTGG